MVTVPSAGDGAAPVALGAIRTPPSALVRVPRPFVALEPGLGAAMDHRACLSVDLAARAGATPVL